MKSHHLLSKLFLIVVLCVCSGLLIFNMYQNKLAEERRCESLTSGSWIGSNRSASIEFFPDGSVNVDRANSEIVGKAIITNSSGSAVEGYYRTYHHCTRVFVFDNQDFRLGTFIFDGKTLESEGGYTYTKRF